MKRPFTLPLVFLLCILVLASVPADADDCYESPWCSEYDSHAFNNMFAGAFGEMIETEGVEPFRLCGFQFILGEGGGIIGSVDCESGSCRAVLYEVTESDEAVELISIDLNGIVSGTTDFLFESSLLITPGDRYAIVLETEDEQWGLWQCCNAGENCCPNARPVRILDGMAVYNDPSYDDYAFSLWIEDVPIPVNEVSWGQIKSLSTDGGVKTER